MGKKSYLGGSTIIGPHDNSHYLDNTSPLQIEEDYKTPFVYFDGGIDEDLTAELDGFDHLFISELFTALQHVFLHNDLTALTRMAAEDKSLENYILRLMNKVMIGRKFSKSRGEVIIEREGKLKWGASQIVAIHRAMTASYDPEIDEPLEISETVQELVRDFDASS